MQLEWKISTGAKGAGQNEEGLSESQKQGSIGPQLL